MRNYPKNAALAAVKWPSQSTDLNLFMSLRHYLKADFYRCSPSNPEAELFFKEDWMNFFRCAKVSETSHKSPAALTAPTGGSGK